jgi:hypothetical protein
VNQRSYSLYGCGSFGREMAGVLASVSTSDAEGLVPRKRWTISPRLTDEISAALAHVAPKMDNHPPREVNTGKIDAPVGHIVRVVTLRQPVMAKPWTTSR